MISLVKGKELILSNNVIAATSLFHRVKGLMFQKEILDDDALLIEPCNSIHTCFMNFAIDVVFLNQENCVVHYIENLKPWRVSWIYFESKKVLELKAGTLNNKIEIGDILEFRNV